MLGKHIGEFNVYIKQGLDNKDLVFSKNETQGDMWHKAEIQLPPMAKSTYQVILQFSFTHSTMFLINQEKLLWNHLRFPMAP